MIRRRRIGIPSRPILLREKPDAPSRGESKRGRFAWSAAIRALPGLSSRGRAEASPSPPPRLRLPAVKISRRLTEQCPYRGARTISREEQPRAEVEIPGSALQTSRGAWSYEGFRCHAVATSTEISTWNGNGANLPARREKNGEYFCPAQRARTPNTRARGHARRSGGSEWLVCKLKRVAAGTRGSGYIVISGERCPTCAKT